MKKCLFLGLLNYLTSKKHGKHSDGYAKITIVKEMVGAYQFRKGENMKLMRKLMATLFLFVLLLQSIPFGMVTVMQASSPKPETTSVAKEQPKTVLYYGDWSIWGGQQEAYPSTIPVDKVTHLVVSFLGFDAKGNLQFADAQAMYGAPMDTGVQWNSAAAGIAPTVNAMKADNPNLNVCISIGGWSLSDSFSEVTHDPAARANLIFQITEFLRLSNFDCVDIDWEYPGSVRQPDLVDNKNDRGTPNASVDDAYFYYIFLTELRASLDELGKSTGKYYEISIAAPSFIAGLEKYNYSGPTYTRVGNQWVSNNDYVSVTIADFANVLDGINLMTYDMAGAWDSSSGHQSALYIDPSNPDKECVQKSVEYLISQGVAPEKIVIGSAYYSRGWESVSMGPDPARPGVYGDAKQITQDADKTPSYGAKNQAELKSGDGGRVGGVWPYRTQNLLKSTYPGLQYYYDDVVKAAYLYDPVSGAFFTFDDPRSVEAKSDYIEANDLGGMIMWMAPQDAPTNSRVRDELTNTIYNALYPNGITPKSEVYYPPLNVTADVKAGSQQWNPNAGVYDITIKNNESLQYSTSSEVLQLSEKSAETIKYPLLTIQYKDGVKVPTSGDYRSGTVTSKGQTVTVDLAPVWDAQEIAPGKSYTFQLNSGQAVNQNDIQSITLEQRIGKNGTPYNKQVIYGSDVKPEPEKDTTPPVLTGVINQTVTQGDMFDPMAGVKAVDNVDGDITGQVKVEGRVDTNTPGTYTLIYSVSDKAGNKTTLYSIVTVVPRSIDTNAPVITGANDVTIDINTAFSPLSGVTAYDQEDGDLTNKIQVSGVVNTDVEGVYTLVYTVYDGAGNKGEATRKVTVRELPDTEAPIISGATDETIKINTNFDPKAGVSAMDMKDGDLTNKIVITGKVNTAIAGQYVLNYSVSDAAGNKTSVDRTITVKADSIPPVPTDNPMVMQDGPVMVGYWHNWDNGRGYQGGNAPGMKLTDIDPAYDVINVSFMTSPGAGQIPTFNLQTGVYANEQEFIDDINTLNAQGKSVILSMGGADAHIELHKGQEVELAAEIIRLCDKYGFDGIDIDLEQNAILAADNVQVITDALIIVSNHYAAQGKEFTITMAPEFPYLAPSSPKYAGYINGLEGYYTWINPQFYNQGGDGVVGKDGQWYSQGGSNPTVKGQTDFLYNMVDVLDSGHGGWVQIPANKLVIGLPSSIDAAATGYIIDPNSVYNSIDKLYKEGKQVRGLMTWSVNWDGGTNSAGVNYNWDFARKYGDYVHNLDYDGHTPPEKDTTPPSPITNLNVIDITTNGAKVTYSPSYDAVSGVKYEIYLNGKYQTTTASTSYVLSGLKDNTTYKVEVLAIDAAGNKTDKASTTFTTLEKEVIINNPLAVTNLRATRITENGAYLEYNAAVADAGVQYYEIYLEKPVFFGLFSSNTFVGTTTNLEYPLSGLDDNTAYKGGVVTVDNNGNKSPMATVNFKTKETVKPDTKAPSVPTNLTVSNVTDKSAQLNYGASTDDSGLPVKYEVAKVSKNNYEVVQTTNNTQVSLLNLTQNTDYTYAVRAMDNAGNRSAWSNTVSFTTEASVNPPVDNAWDPAKIYTGGEIVTYNGRTYRAAWWNQGQAPEKDYSVKSGGPAWELIYEGEAIEWDANATYGEGVTVIHNGSLYRSKSWTKNNNPESNHTTDPMQWAQWLKL